MNMMMMFRIYVIRLRNMFICFEYTSRHTQWRQKRYGRYGGHHTNLKFGMALLKFGQLIFKKITEIVAQMSDLKAKMHQNRFQLGLCPRPHWGSWI